MKISVFGLGYVGTITAACLSEKKNHVIGVDISQQKVDAIRNGNSPVVEPGVDELIKTGVASGTIYATTDPDEAVRDSDLSIICVGTPSLRSGGVNLSYVHQVCEQIAKAILDKGRPHTVCLRSTVIPGSTRRIESEIFSACPNTDLYFVPEFLREGTALNDFRDPSTYVIGTVDGESPTNPNVAGIYSTMTPVIINWEEAETVKYSFNAFHALKVGFANEIGRLGKAIGLDSRIVMKILSDDSVLNISPYYLRPGNPYGGSCLPKDVAALNNLARLRDVDIPLVGMLSESNRLHQELLADMVIQTGRRKVCILGLSFKTDTDDLRNSPMVSLAETLLGKGFELSIVDPYLKPTEIVGANLTAAAALPHLNRLIRRDVKAAIEESELVVAALKCVEEETLAEALNDSHVVIDVNGWSALEKMNGEYVGFCW